MNVYIYIYIYICIICIHIYMYIYIYIYVYINILEYQKFNVLVNHLRAVTQYFVNLLVFLNKKKVSFK